MTPQTDWLRKTSPVLRVLTHIFGVSKKDRWDNGHFYSKPRHVTTQIDHQGKSSPVLRVSTHIYGVSKEIDRKMFFSRGNLGM